MRGNHGRLWVGSLVSRRDYRRVLKLIVTEVTSGQRQRPEPRRARTGTRTVEKEERGRTLYRRSEKERDRVKERNREETVKRYGTGMKTIRRRETDLSAASKERRRRREGWHTPDATALRHRRAPLVPLLPFRVDAARAFSALRVSVAKRTHAELQICR